MYIRNFEREFGSGGPISGATVTIYVAILTGAHGAPVSFTDHNNVFGASTTSNPDGMWEAKDLPDGQYYDVKVEYNSNIKWYKGRTKHIVEHLYDDSVPDASRNLLPNGGQDLININGTAAIAIAVADPGDVQGAGADGWNCYGGAGDAGTVQATNATRSPNSAFAMKITYNRAGGANQVHYNKFLPDPLWQQLRGQTITLSFQVFQETLSSGCHVYVFDGLTTTLGVPTATVGLYTTITVTHVISGVATQLRAGVRTNRANAGSQAFYVDNGIIDIGPVAPVFGAEQIESAPSVIYTTIDDTVVPLISGNNLDKLLDGIGNRLKGITGKASWLTSPVTTIEAIKTAADALAVLVANKLTKTGDTMLGVLNMNPTVRLRFLEDVNHTWDFVASAGEFFLAANIAGTGTPQLKVNTAGLFFWDGVAFRTIWMSTNDGVGSGLDADLFRGLNALARANHTGTQAPATISPQGAGSGLSADLLDGQDGTFYQARANHTGTQLASTISDLAASILARINHTGTQLAATISDFAATGNALWSALGHTHTYGNANATTVTYVGNGAGANRNIALGLGMTPLFAFFQMIAGGSNTMILANHDGVMIQPGGPGSVGAALVGASFGFGIVTVPPGSWNTAGITYRLTVFGT